jgi:hypothetical protein
LWCIHQVKEITIYQFIFGKLNFYVYICTNCVGYTIILLKYTSVMKHLKTFALFEVKCSIDIW